VSGAQQRLPLLNEPDIERLIKLPAWERAKVYEIAGLGLGDRSLIELEVRVRIAAQHRRRQA
jgi:hypothetical protein